jgi:hypothetical protein
VVVDVEFEEKELLMVAEMYAKMVGLRELC